MSNIKIMVDTGADMPLELLEKYELGLINFMVNFGDDSFVAGEELNNEQFYQKLKDGEIHPKTAQTPYQDMYDYLLDESKKYDTLIYFTISSRASGQFQTATLISREIMEENPGTDIRIVDTQSFSVYITDAAIYAAQLAKDGKSADEIIEASLERMKEWEVYLLVDSLDALEKGGRITKTSAIIGTLLDIKPVLTIREGLIEPLLKLRGKKKMFKKLIDLIKEDESFNSENPEFIVVHSNRDYADEVIGLLEEDFGQNSIFMESEFGPIIGTHTGSGALAILFRKK